MFARHKDTATLLKYLLNIWKLNVSNLEITELTLIGQEHFPGVD